MSDVTKVGELIPPGSQRDAIHIAVAPVVASERLEPGQTIGFTNDDMRSVEGCELPMSVGIVDPFLRQTVEEGQSFWMFLHPNTITSLRHNWTHPAFGGVETDHAEVSKKWMKQFADGYGVPYQDMLDAGANWLNNNDYYCEGGTFEGETVPDEYWDHYQEITGRKVKSGERESFFTCSC